MTVWLWYLQILRCCLRKRQQRVSALLVRATIHMYKLQWVWPHTYAVRICGISHYKQKHVPFSHILSDAVVNIKGKGSWGKVFSKRPLSMSRTLTATPALEWRVNVRPMHDGNDFNLPACDPEQEKISMSHFYPFFLWHETHNLPSSTPTLSYVCHKMSAKCLKFSMRTAKALRWCF